MGPCQVTCACSWPPALFRGHSWYLTYYCSLALWALGRWLVRVTTFFLTQLQFIPGSCRVRPGATPGSERPVGSPQGQLVTSSRLEERDRASSDWADTATAPSSGPFPMSLSHPQDHLGVHRCGGTVLRACFPVMLRLSGMRT